MPIDIGAGFALMGQSVAQTAQAAALEMIRSEAEERRVKLANDLADARESKGRAETQAFQTSEREAKERFETPERDAKIASQKAQTNQAQTATDIAKDKWSRQTRAGAEMAGALDGKGGTSKSYTDRIAQFESGGGKMVPNELGSGAYGPYQFMPGTWSDVRAKNTDLGLPEDMKQATPDQHKAAFDRFTAGNADALKRAGIEPTAANLYLAHRFGPAGAEKVIKADENAPLGNVLPGDWQQQNPDMRGQTAGGFKRLAEERMKGVTLGDGGTTGTGGALSKIPSDVKTLIASAAKSGDVDKVLELTMGYVARQQEMDRKTDIWLPLNEDAAKRLLGSGYDSSKAYQMNRASGEIKPIGGSMVNINNQSESHALKTQIDAASKTHSELQEGASAARSGLNQIQRLDELLKEIDTGKFSTSALEIKRIAKSFGIDLGDKEIGQQEAATALAKQLALALRNPSSGAGMPGALSDSDRQFLEKMVPGLETTPEGRTLMMQTARAMYQRSIDTARVANEYLRSKEFATDPSGLYAKLQEFADKNPLFGGATQGAGSTGNAAEGNVSGFGPNSGPAGPAGTPRIADQKGYDALAPGTLYMAPDGTMRTKR